MALALLETQCCVLEQSILTLLSTILTQELSLHDRTSFYWDVKNQLKTK